jgi:hypothetical protein
MALNTVLKVDEELVTEFLNFAEALIKESIVVII